jgi:hypothetical protein
MFIYGIIEYYVAFTLVSLGIAPIPRIGITKPEILRIGRGRAA